MVAFTDFKMAYRINQAIMQTPRASQNHADIRWHTLELEAVFRLLETRPEGLSEDEARRRFEQVPPQAVSAARKVSIPVLIRSQFRQASVLILLAGIGLSLVLDHGAEPAVMAILLFFATGLSVLQEYRAEQCQVSLEARMAPKAGVRRNGSLKTIPADQLVAGDIVQLGVGDRVPADLRWIETVALKVNEVSLTGESPATEKTALPLADGVQMASLGERHNLGFAGTTVVCGRGTGVVFSAGMRTASGHAAGLLRDTEPRQTRTRLQKDLERVGQTLTLSTGLVVVLMVAGGMLRGMPLMDLLLPGIALLASLPPVTLPAMATIFLARGAHRLIGHPVFGRRSSAIETLGCLSVLCVNKTATLTRDEMTVRKIWVAGETVSVSGVGYEPVGRLLQQGQAMMPTPVITDLLRAGLLCNDAELERIRSSQWRVRGTATEGALIVAALKAGLVPARLRADWPRSGEIAFTPQTRQMATLHRGSAGQDLVCAKGAVDVILSACSGWEGPDGEEPLNEAVKTRILMAAETLAADAFRVLAIAHRPQGALSDTGSGLCFLGLIGMMNPPRLESAPAVARCADAGIKVVMMSGDHPATVRAMARELGILRKGILITGDELAALNDDDLDAAVDHIEVYARISPEQKLRIVERLQAQGQVVGLTGRSLHDVPALKQADIGIAPGGSCDAAREAADLLVTDEPFASIMAGIEEGHRTFSALRKGLIYPLPVPLGLIGLMAATTLSGLPLPLDTVQVLYLGLVVNRLQAVALAEAPGEDDRMPQAPRPLGEGLITPAITRLLWVGALMMVLIQFGLFLWALRNGRPLIEAMSLVVVTLTLIPCCNHDRLNGIVLFSALLLVGFVTIPPLQSLPGVVPLSSEAWWMSLAAVAGVVAVFRWIRHRVQTT